MNAARRQMITQLADRAAVGCLVVVAVSLLATIPVAFVATQKAQAQFEAQLARWENCQEDPDTVDTLAGQPLRICDFTQKPDFPGEAPVLFAWYLAGSVLAPDSPIAPMKIPLGVFMVLAAALWAGLRWASRFIAATG